jgi:hypothetical protein
MGHERLTRSEHKGRDAIVIEQLLRELDELRELDRRRNAHAPGSAARDAATLEVDLRSRRLMDRFRDFQERRARAARPGLNLTRPIDVRYSLSRNRASLLN